LIGKGHLLVSDVSLAEDYIFRRSVILICDKENPMGFILNKPLDIDLSNILSGVRKKFKLYFGGPVSKDMLFCVHKSELKLKFSKQVTKDLSYGLDLNEIISKTASGELNDENIMFFLGYSGWSDKQLLKEIRDNFWKINKKYSKNIFSKSREDLWKKLTEKTGGDSYLWSNAPENLQDN
tara:strand:+ start:175 stop:714 length:540 start_codon:yes stop_codon:yes gene_type:complete